jgi:hypothetical protein
MTDRSVDVLTTAAKRAERIFGRESHTHFFGAASFVSIFAIVVAAVALLLVTCLQQWEAAIEKLP